MSHTTAIEPSKLDVKQLIPQQEPFVMIGRLLVCNEITTVTSFTVEDDNIFVDNGTFMQAGLLENVAQTCAARQGFMTLNKPVRLGFIGAINNFRFVGSLPKTGETIQTEINVTAEVGNIILMDAKIECRQKIIAQGTMKVALNE